ARDGPAPCAAADASARPAALDDAGPRLDARAKDAYRHRLDDLRSELAEAERAHDRGREEAVRAEMEFIRHEIAAAVGLGGRDRPVGSGTERARLTVPKRINDAVAGARLQPPRLAEHVGHPVRTGFVCAYVPGPDSPGPWGVCPRPPPSYAVRSDLTTGKREGEHVGHDRVCVIGAGCSGLAALKE